jgi:hypothetical protein
VLVESSERHCAVECSSKCGWSRRLEVLVIIIILIIITMIAMLIGIICNCSSEGRSDLPCLWFGLQTVHSSLLRLFALCPLSAPGLRLLTSSCDYEPPVAEERVRAAEIPLPEAAATEGGAEAEEET